ncbi:MAG TPA: GLUG motif-containing protein [Rhizomicrobium sp.]|nr:GLUG motif-containing protein [Rhizomicrobium sp.]
MRARFRILSLCSIATMCLAAGAHAALNISTDPTQNMNCSGGVCTATAKAAVLNVHDLTDMLASGDLKVATGNSGAQDIHVATPVTWTSASRLTLDALHSIVFGQAVSVAGSGAVTLITNDGGTGGDYWFLSAGSISFWDLKSSLIINGQKFTLVNDISSLAKKIAGKPAGHYALANSYDASVDGAYKHSPVTTVFTGTFEGLGNAIQNLTIAVPSENLPLVGLFAQSAGTLRDTNLPNVSLSKKFFGDTSYGGALVGENDGSVLRASSSGIIADAGDMAAGGLIGINRGQVANASSAVGGGIGGLAVNNYGVITQSFATGDTPGSDAGGLVYYNDGKGSITLSYATGDATAETAISKYGNAGGLVGVNYGDIAQSFATGAITAKGGGKTTAGGLVGLSGNGVISQTYATGAVINRKKAIVGGLVGELGPKASIQQSYSVGAITVGGSSLAGGAIGYDKSSGQQIKDLDWDLDTSGIDDPGRGAGAPRNDPGITGLTDDQLKSGLPDGFDPKVWGQDPNINNSYPYLLANPPPDNAPREGTIKARRRG